MIKREEVFKIGTLGKPHGIKGEISFAFTDDVFDRIDADYVILETEGIMVPFFIEEYRFKNDSTALIKFEDIDTLEKAKELTGCQVFFERKVASSEDDTVTWAMLIGFTVVDSATGKQLGRLINVNEDTINRLFEIEDDKKKILLLPAPDEFITDVNTEKQLITMDIPDGILEL